jgi:hypothetical protein
VAERGERLPEGAAADREFGAQGPFRGQANLRRISGRDELQELVEDLVREAPSARRA